MTKLIAELMNETLKKLEISIFKALKTGARPTKAVLADVVNDTRMSEKTVLVAIYALIGSGQIFLDERWYLRKPCSDERQTK